MAHPILLKTVEYNLAPNETVVKELKFLLREAEEGRIRTFIGISTYLTNNMRKSYCTDKENINPCELMGALVSLINTIDKNYGLTEEMFSPAA